MLTLQEFIENFAPKTENIVQNYFNIKINSRKLISFDGYYTILDNNDNELDKIKFRCTIDKNNNYKIQMLNNKDYKRYYLWRKFELRKTIETIFEYWVYNNKDNLAQFFSKKK